MSRWQRLSKRLRSWTRKPLSIALSVAAVVTAGWIVAPPPAAHASAPVMALPKAEGRDPASEALMHHERLMKQQAQDELSAMSAKAREIEREQGPAARVKFEKEFKQQQQARAEEKIKGLEELRRNLLAQGIDPWCDIEGQRQVAFYEQGVDLGEVAGTPFYLEKQFEQNNYKRSQAYKLQYNRQVIACMVKDMKNRGIDELEYFRAHPDKVEGILNLPMAQAQQLAEKYAANLEEYGQITVPKAGEMSALEKMNEAAKSGEGKKRAKEEAKRLKAEAKAKAAEAKRIAKEEAQRAKATAAAAAASAAAAAKSAVGRATSSASNVMAASSTTTAEEQSMDDFFYGSGEEEEDGSMATSSGFSPFSALTDGDLPIIPITAVVVAGGGGAFAFKTLKEKAARDEEERQRQFRLLMGLDDEKEDKPKRKKSRPTFEDELDDFDVDDEAAAADKWLPRTPAPVEEPAPAPAPKKRRGLKSVFSRKKNNRETDIMALVDPEAEASEFATTLAKILTFGAPGRFPGIVGLPGGMPFDTFDLEEAESTLIQARAEAGLSLEESAEVFANVVNCMLIDIVDLAASALKEDDKVCNEALNIVVDFMQHAASLYDSVAGGVVLTPVTYGGDMGKSKLEQMYSKYSGQAMTDMENMRDDFDDRLRLLQDVFQISDKKAEGLMLKVMQKNMMEMLKSGEGLEGMQEMLGAMGGMEGMEGLGGMGGMPGMDGEEPNPEQVKEMLLALKGMKDSGQFSKEDLASIKKEFQNSFGSSIDELASSEKPLDPTEQELLDLMKSILD